MNACLCNSIKNASQKQKERCIINKLNIVEHYTQCLGVLYQTLSTIVLSIEYNFMNTCFICLFACLDTFYNRNQQL